MTTELTQQLPPAITTANQPAVPAGGGGRKRERQLKYNYPLFTTVRLSRENTDRLKAYGKYGSSIDDCIAIVLNLVERGYETPKDQRSF